MMKPCHSACFVLGAMSLLLSAEWAAADDDEGMVDKIAAVVGDDIILLSEVMEQAEPVIRQMEQAGQEAGGSLMEGRQQSQIKSQIEEILNGMIDDAIFEREAREMKITVTQEELDMAVENMAKENGIDVPTFKRAIKAQGMDYLTYRNRLRSQLMKFKILNMRVRSRVKISEAEARQHYNDQVRDIRATGTYEGAHILFRAPLGASAQVAAKAKRKAEAVLERLKKGESFADIARAESDDAATAPGGGSLGTLHPGIIPPVLERAFFDLEVGEVAGPIRTPAGFHIIRLNAREDLGIMPFAKVKDKIVQRLQEEEMERQSNIWLKELRSRIFIDVRM
jgi:peptidyl-prolyl cis-trans isomerase SurA